MNLEQILKKHPNIRNILILFSGGKDSLVTMHYFLREYERLDKELKDRIKNLVIVHLDTGIGVKECKDYVIETLENLPYDYKILKPIGFSFERGIRKYGLPFTFPTNCGARWCMRELKIKPLDKFVRELGLNCTLLCMGIRCYESNRRFLIYGKWINEKFYRLDKQKYHAACYTYAPCIDFTDKDVNRYIEKYNLKVNPVSKVLGMSGECLCHFHTWSKKKQLILKSHFPDSYDMITKIIERARVKATKSVACRKRVLEVKRQKTLDEFLR